MCFEKMQNSSGDQLRPAGFRPSMATRISLSSMDLGCIQALACAKPFHRRAGRPSRVVGLIPCDIFRNQPRAPLEGEVGPEPAHGHEKAVVEAHQQVHVGMPHRSQAMKPLSLRLSQWITAEFRPTTARLPRLWKRNGAGVS